MYQCGGFVGFEYIYAYIKNIQLLSYVATVLLSGILILLIALRVENEIDGDDWMHLMYFVVPLCLFFICIDFSPSMNHIRKVRTMAQLPYVAQTQGENNEEVPISEPVTCDNIVLQIPGLSGGNSKPQL